MKTPSPRSSAPPPDLVGRAVLAAEEGRYEEAARLAEAGVNAGMTHPALYKFIGVEFDRRGRPDRAAEYYKAALDRGPEDGALLNALGLALARTGRAEEGSRALERAASLLPDFAPTRFNLGYALEQQGRLIEAEAAYEEAVRRDPGHLAALSSLAVLAARRADWANARARAESVLATAPRHPLAALALAMTELGEGRPEQAEAGLREALSHGLPGHERAVAYGLLGEALDAQERAREAFAAFTAANVGLKSVYERSRPLGGEGVVERVRRLTDEVEALPEPPLEESPSPSRPGLKRHVFLLGFPRSGTTLAGQILAARPGVLTLDEREHLGDAAAAFLMRPGGLSAFWALPEADLERWRDAYWHRVLESAAPGEGATLVDKLPMNTLALPLIRRLFPEARIVFMQRDPRDVVLSCFRQRFVLNPTNYEFLTLEGAARLYDAVMRFEAACARRLQASIRRQSLERLVLGGSEEADALARDLGLEGASDLDGVGVRARTGALATPSAARIAGGINDQGIGRWRAYAEDLRPVRWMIEPWAEAFGYEAWP